VLKFRDGSIYDNHFAAQTGQKIVIVPVKDVDWIEASGDYVTLHVGGKSHLLRQTMRWMESKLDPKRFLRIHRSAIVHATKIRGAYKSGKSRIYGSTRQWHRDKSQPQL
jgi:two-component system LytT family response regulator